MTATQPADLDLSAAVDAATEALNRWQWPGRRGREVRDLVTRMVAAAAPHIAAAERHSILSLLRSESARLKAIDYAEVGGICSAALDDFADLIVTAPESTEGE